MIVKPELIVVELKSGKGGRGTPAPGAKPPAIPVAIIEKPNPVLGWETIHVELKNRPALAGQPHTKNAILAAAGQPGTYTLAPPLMRPAARLFVA